MYTYTIYDLAQERREASLKHREIFHANNESAKDVLGFLNGIASGALTIVEDTMKREGNYPWSESETADYILSEWNPKSVMQQVECFEGRDYFWNGIRWLPVSRYDEDTGDAVHDPFTYNLCDLTDYLKKLDAISDVNNPVNAREEYGEDILQIHRSYVRISRCMSKEGNRPITLDERADVALRNLPPDAWGGVHKFNGRSYSFALGGWLPCDKD